MESKGPSWKYWEYIWSWLKQLIQFRLSSKWSMKGSSSFLILQFWLRVSKALSLSYEAKVVHIQDLRLRVFLNSYKNLANVLTIRRWLKKRSKMRIKLWCRSIIFPAAMRNSRLLEGLKCYLWRSERNSKGRL